MSDVPPCDDKIHAALMSAAQTDQSFRRPRFKQLMRYKEPIRQLRARDASFKTIAGILRTNSFRVSHETIRNFYREEIEQKPRRKRRRQGNNRRAKPNGLKRAKTWNIGEPRIARIEDL